MTRIKFFDPVTQTYIPVGQKGLSAYQVWINEGNTGTEQDFFEYLASLILPAPENLTVGNLVKVNAGKTGVEDAGLATTMLFNQLNYLYAAPEAFLPRTTNGAQYAKEESTTYDQMKGTFLFDPATSEGIQLEVRNYGSGSLTTKYFKCKLHYKVKMGNGVPEFTKVAFRIQGAIEQDTVDVACGTAVQMNQTIEAQNTVYHTAWSSLITASGTIAENCALLIEVNRYADDVDNDTYPSDVAFIGAEFQFNIPAPS